MSKGFLSFVLHAHLPFVRHPESDNLLEELWLFEAISETYLPLLGVFRRLEDEGVPFRLAVSISPTLAAMLEDELLQERYVGHLDRLLELAEKEISRTAGDGRFQPLALMYRDMFSSAREDFTKVYGGRILKGFDFFMKKGRLEVITTAATHAYLPLYQMYPEVIRTQIQIASRSHCRLFGKAPRGFFLPEMGYYPDLEAPLKEAGINYFFAASHGLDFAPGCPRGGVYAPVLCPNGLAVFGRDEESADALWSDTGGYPGDISYRDFYRDIGFDLPMDYIAPYIRSSRNATGFKYYAITGETDQKLPYDVEAAQRKIDEHADNFIYNRLNQVRRLGESMDRPPLVTAPFDAELFGHWWFEGPAWLETLFRKLALTDELELISPSDYLALYPENPTVQPVFSSWGNNGYSEVWLDGSNDWIYRHIHKAAERMEELARRYPDEKGLKERSLNQAAREILLSQASDWPFIMHAGTTVPYAVRRIKEHLSNFSRIYEALSSGVVSTEWLLKLEQKNTIFPELDYRIFRG
ncbi:MAG: DUF1957 domain-containing protein [Spirochaetales bacterium]|jgi:1,4-alpha-glucan branching enzyme|nr:DUF1957 domain-containing protein [Spirochaetales bacterium]